MARFLRWHTLTASSFAVVDGVFGADARTPLAD
jgi:hypothetical protein